MREFRVRAIVALSVGCLLPALATAQAPSTEPVLSSSKGSGQAPSTGSGQAYPSRTVRIIVGFAPGGATDVIARLLSPKLGAYMGQQFVIENRPGADALLAMELVVKAAPDGHTLLMNSSSQAINASIYKSISFDTQKDFSPVINIGEVPSFVVVHPSLPVNNVRELLQLAKTRKGDLFYAASASSTYLATEMLNRMGGIQMVRVAYKGAAPAMIGLLSGEVQVMITGVGPIMPHVKAGKARALAVTTLKRTPLMPQLPTVDESGVAGYESGVWYAMFAPAGVPRAIIDRLNADIRKALNEPDVKAGIVAQGIDALPSTPDELDKYVAAEIRKWAKVAQESGIKPE